MALVGNEVILIEAMVPLYSSVAPKTEAGTVVVFVPPGLTTLAAVWVNGEGNF